MILTIPTLTNAVELSKEFKMRKPPPISQEIQYLTPEDYARLRSNGEYFWVKVDAVNPFVGIVLDEPVFSQQFSKDDKIYFGSENIFDIRAKEWLTNEGL